MPILAIENLHKSFGAVQALRGINTELAGPGVYGFLGPNGAGKTTTFKLACALLRPTSGHVFVNGIDVQKDPRRALAHVGVQFDSPAFYPFLTGRENLRVLSKWAGVDDAGGIEGVLSLVDLQRAGSKKVGAYSWGMRQRLGLASALLFDPKLLLLDEPTSGLDPAGIADVRNLLPKLALEDSRTILVSSHRMDEVEQVCDRVIILHDGSIIASGTPDELASEEVHVEIDCPDPGRALMVLAEVDGVNRVRQAGKNRVSCVVSAQVAPAIHAVLADKGVVVEQLTRNRESLEEMYFRITGTRNDEA
jgi:ABC-2 type transport system ATP-binding protein